VDRDVFFEAIAQFVGKRAVDRIAVLGPGFGALAGNVNPKFLSVLDKVIVVPESGKILAPQGHVGQ